MARMTFKAGDEYALKLCRLATRSDEIAKKAIYEAAKIVTDKIREKMNDNLNDTESCGKRKNVMFKNYYNKTSGEMGNSLGITSISRDKDGNWNAKIGFDGYDRKGVPNQLKARVMESGSSTIKKRPFVRPAVNATKAKAKAEMERVITEEIKNQMGG